MRFVDAFWEAMSSGKGCYAFPGDAEFMDMLSRKDLYSSLKGIGVKYFLYSLERHCRYAKGLPSFDNPALSIKHVMPQTLGPEWRAYLSGETLNEYGSLLHRCGNLALTVYNSEMSNKPFNDKKAWYRESNFYYTRRLGDIPEWQVGAIKTRCRQIVSEAVCVWPLPSQYQTVYVHLRHRCTSWARTRRSSRQRSRRCC